MIFKTVLTTLWVVSILYTASRVGEERKPETWTGVLIGMIYIAIMIYGLWNWA